MANFQKDLNDPSAVYEQPQDVLLDPTLNKDQKLKILKQWEYDARQLIVAEEENMVGDSPSMLQRVLAAIHQLDANFNGR